MILGGYYHIDYKEKRRIELQKEQEDRHHASEHRFHQNSTADYFSPRSVSPLYSQHLISSNNDLLYIFFLLRFYLSKIVCLVLTDNHLKQIKRIAI